MVNYRRIHAWDYGSGECPYTHHWTLIFHFGFQEVEDHQHTAHARLRFSWFCFATKAVPMAGGRPLHIYSLFGSAVPSQRGNSRDCTSQSRSLRSREIIVEMAGDVGAEGEGRRMWKRSGRDNIGAETCNTGSPAL